MAFTLSSSAFVHQEAIPSVYTCDGKNISPALVWSEAPAATKSFVLILDDPDAPMGTWDHWLLYNIPASVHELSEDIQTLPAGALVGANSWGRTDYGGPCPPDREHRYFFKLYALDEVLNIEPGVDKQRLLKLVKGHVLAEAELMGTYKRKSI